MGTADKAASYSNDGSTYFTVLEGKRTKGFRVCSNTFPLTRTVLRQQAKPDGIVLQENVQITEI